MAEQTAGVGLRVRPAGGTKPRTHWSSRKSQKTLSLTDEVWELLGNMADYNQSNRSEIVEVAIRQAVITKMDITEARRSQLGC